MTESAPPGAPRKPNRTLLFYAGGAVAAIVVAVILATVLAGGGGSGTKTAATASAAAGASTSPAPGGAGAASVDVTATDFQFDKATIELPAGQAVTVNFKNGGQAPHSIQFRTAKGGGELTAGATGAITDPGKTAKLSFTSPAPGTYYFECGVHPGEMNGTLTVGGSQVTAPTAAPSPAVAAATSFDVTATNFQFDKPALQAPANSKVTVNFKNGGQAPHSIQFRTAKGGGELTAGATGAVTQPGQSATVSFTAPAAGTYYFECAVHPGSMNGTFTVTGASQVTAPTTAPTTAPPPAVAAATSVDVTATNFQFDKPTIALPANRPVTINFKNGGPAPHSIQFRTAKGGGELVPGATGPITQAGGSATLSFTAPGAGTYYFECAVHPGMMNGTLTVSGATSLDVTATNFQFDKPAIELPANSAVTINFKNGGPAPHSIQFRTAKGGGELVAGATGPITQAGQTATLTFTAPGPGTYYFECAVHPGAMNGTLTVTGAAVAPPPALPSVTPPTAVSRLGSGVHAQALSRVNVTQDPTAGSSAVVLRTLQPGDRMIVVTNTPPGSTFVITEGLIFWRVLVDGTTTVGWVPEVTTDGSRRLLDIAK